MLATITQLYGIADLCAAADKPPDAVVATLRKLDISPAAMFRGSVAYDERALEQLRRHFNGDTNPPGG